MQSVTPKGADTQSVPPEGRKAASEGTKEQVGGMGQLVVGVAGVGTGGMGSCMLAWLPAASEQVGDWWWAAWVVGGNRKAAK